MPERDALHLREAALHSEEIALLVQGNFTGIFSTHQHVLFDSGLPLLDKLYNCEPYHMAVPTATAEAASSSGAAQAAFTVAKGAAFDSQAFAVARAQVRFHDSADAVSVSKGCVSSCRETTGALLPFHDSF